MFEYLKSWYERKFSDPHSVTLLLLLTVLIAFLYFVGSLIIPVLVALVIAYLLEWPVLKLQSLGLARLTACATVILTFAGILVGVFVIMVPVLWQQTANLFQEAPNMLEQGKSFLMHSLRWDMILNMIIYH